ncbi:hypothetical protein [Agromyces ramosus]|uniref:Uncharacterized protein n=1 Tax=Agromyces ramosus TaxID=33879 RepID=A0ABU0R9T2_9MICO|nr:hypothetical protein [Agromyces ramosus]MDQ0894839.1 hypothetical protein [Agromyces ramosus]
MTSAPTLGAIHEVNERLRANPTPLEKPVQTRSLTAGTPDPGIDDLTSALDVEWHPGPAVVERERAAFAARYALRGTRPRFVTSGLYPASTWWNVRPALERTGNSSAARSPRATTTSSSSRSAPKLRGAFIKGGDELAHLFMQMLGIAIAVVERAEDLCHEILPPFLLVSTA